MTRRVLATVELEERPNGVLVLLVSPEGKTVAVAETWHQAEPSFGRARVLTWRYEAPGGYAYRHLTIAGALARFCGQVRREVQSAAEGHIRRLKMNDQGAGPATSHTPPGPPVTPTPPVESNPKED